MSVVSSHSFMPSSAVEGIESILRTSRLKSLNTIVRSKFFCPRPTLSKFTISISLRVKATELRLPPKIVNPIHKALKVHVDFVLPIPLPLLLFNLIRVIGRSLSATQSLNYIHNLAIELDILGFLVPHHYVVVQMKVKESDHLILGWLKKCMLNIRKHYIHPLILPSGRITKPIHMSFKCTR
ncbi:hypothetical protein PanWU01x14_087270 [Parasponia andersonii]|uniref:Uncharacterized protein n=1 Tax=Parasponia andersonii TaxID=3476 RepID=A0A2P5D8K9_PARAD|nr:hypothetical protein PanWU01x14_087270 [Parasponia andersonii]